MEITIPWTPVKALLHLTGKTGIREWCNAVWIDRQGPELVIWATNGVTLGAFRTEEPSTDGPDICLPRHVVEACKGFDVQATVKREDDGRMSISCMGTTHYWHDKGFSPVDWRRVVPRGEADGRAMQFDVTLLDAFVKVRKALRPKNETKVAGGVLIAHSGPRNDAGADSMLVQLLDLPNFVGVLMPLREEAWRGHLQKAAPDWVRLHSRVAAAAAAAPVTEEAADLV